MRGGQRYVGFRQRARNHGWKAIRTSKLSLINVTFGNRVQPPIFHSILWNAASNRSPDFYRNTFPFEIVVKLASKGKYYKEDEKRKLLFVWADVVEAPSRSPTLLNSFFRPLTSPLPLQQISTRPIDRSEFKVTAPSDSNSDPRELVQ